MRRLVAWFGGLALAVWLLSSVGHGALAPPPGSPSQWSAWAGGRSTADAAMAVSRLVALGLGWYLLVATVAGAVLRLLQFDAAVAVADALTVPAVRRLLQAALGAGVVLVTVAPVAADAPSARPPVMHKLVDDPPSAPVPAPAPEPAPTPDTWVVRPGDHFWSIAARTLGPDASEAEVAAYWRRLVDANRGRLHDADNADLVFPGQVFDLPSRP
jgi:nucleoid-associated protein YgaU